MLALAVAAFGFAGCQKSTSAGSPQIGEILTKESVAFQLRAAVDRYDHRPNRKNYGLVQDALADLDHEIVYLAGRYSGLPIEKRRQTADRLEVLRKFRAEEVTHFSVAQVEAPHASHPEEHRKAKESEFAMDEKGK